MPAVIATDSLFPGSAWEHTESEAPPRKAGRACNAPRSQAEPGNKKFKCRLDQAGAKAEQLAALLRERGEEAYVFHDRHESMVTIGSFVEIGRPLDNGKTDLLPTVARIMETYGPIRKPVRGQNGVSLSGIQPRARYGYVFDIAPRAANILFWIVPGNTRFELPRSGGMS